MKMDLAIRNGFLFDGAGNPARKTDIGIHDGRIARIGRIAETEAERTVDAAGLAVCPGFIDMHNHVDNGVLAYPSVDSYIMQGVTTSVTGNCGASMAPLDDATIDLSRRYLAPFVPPSDRIDWRWRIADVDSPGLAFWWNRRAYPQPPDLARDDGQPPDSAALLAPLEEELETEADPEEGFAQTDHLGHEGEIEILAALRHRPGQRVLVLAEAGRVDVRPASEHESAESPRVGGGGGQGDAILIQVAG